jgi:hypothetical protein
VRISLRKSLFCAALAAFIVPTSFAGAFPSSGPTVPGKQARLRGGLAAAPADAPIAVKRAIWAANQLRTKPYRYGGGHRSFNDNGYDCSGTVSYALAAAGLVRAPLCSKEFRGYGSRGHTFAVIAGLRLDTTPWNSSRNDAPRWRPTERAPHGFDARHPIGL